MKHVTRKQMRAWLAPMRACFAQMRSGEVDSIRGYAVTRLDQKDDYARIDFCINGFSALIDRLCPDVDTATLHRISKALANGVPLTIAEIDSALSLLRRCEDRLIKRTVAEVKSAVLTEQVCIEIDELGLREAA